MQKSKPYFKYRQASHANNYVASIEVDGEVLHKIENFDEFYKTFGYTQESRSAGVLPDEFIWSEYINNTAADFTACCQMHIIEYLRMHSASFNEEYGEHYESWQAAHAEIRKKRGMACVACKAKPLCKK
ncbi:MAG: hypothetical protein HY016_12375 [Nitrosomonadales bacterium]|nr:hypothetical protein [Nitrosomonadales bacterium]